MIQSFFSVPPGVQVPVNTLVMAGEALGPARPATANFNRSTNTLASSSLNFRVNSSNPLAPSSSSGMSASSDTWGRNLFYLARGFETHGPRIANSYLSMSIHPP